MLENRANPAPPVPPRKQFLARPFVRIAIVAGCFAAFLAIASVINPESSVARSTKARNDSGFALANQPINTSARVEAAPAPGLSRAGVPLGSLTGPTSTIEILGGSDSFTYSIFDATGTALLIGAGSQDVYKTLPDFDVRNLMADVDIESGY